MFVPDNYSRFEQHMAEQERQLERLPECSECGEKIQDEYCYEVNGEYICERCMEEHKRSTDSVI